MIGRRSLTIGLLAATLALAACDVELLGPDDRPLVLERLRLSVSSTGQVLEVDGGATQRSPEDGVLQVSPGDTVLATHRSDDGREVTARIAGWPGDDGS